MSRDTDERNEREPEKPERVENGSKDKPAVPKKNPEPADVLRRREEWFRKRAE